MAISGRWTKRAAGAAVSFFAAGAVLADNVVPETVWSCAYNGKTAVLCELVQAPVPSEAGQDEASSALPPAGPLPPLVDIISTSPGALANHVIQIPLHTPAEDMLRVEQLAESVMCANNPSCRLEF